VPDGSERPIEHHLTNGERKGKRSSGRETESRESRAVISRETGSRPNRLENQGGRPSQGLNDEEKVESYEKAETGLRSGCPPPAPKLGRKCGKKGPERAVR